MLVGVVHFVSFHYWRRSTFNSCRLPCFLLHFISMFQSLIFLAFCIYSTKTKTKTKMNRFERQ